MEKVDLPSFPFLCWWAYSALSFHFTHISISKSVAHKKKGNGGFKGAIPRCRFPYPDQERTFEGATPKGVGIEEEDVDR